MTSYAAHDSYDRRYLLRLIGDSLDLPNITAMIAKIAGDEASSRLLWIYLVGHLDGQRAGENKGIDSAFDYVYAKRGARHTKAAVVASANARRRRGGRKR